MNNVKHTLFDICWFFEHNADYFQKVGNYDKAIEQTNKYEGCMAVIESLGWVEDYKKFVETGEM